MANSTSDFDAAKAISDLLKDMEKERQQRVLRWVAESLDIALHVKTGAGHDLTTGAAVSAVGASGLSRHAPEGRSTDVKTFVELKSPKNDIQFATVIAYYYRFEAPADDRRDAITAEILQNAARLAGRARFTNPLTTLNNAKKQGYLDAADRGTFAINSVGENLVAMTLPGGGNSTKPKPRSTQRSKGKKPAGKPSRRKS